jgi:hypothetical protein
MRAFHSDHFAASTARWHDGRLYDISGEGEQRSTLLKAVQTVVAASWMMA